MVELTFTTPIAAHCCMETHGSVVQWEGDQVTVWHSTQSVFGTRSSVANNLSCLRRTPMHRCRMRSCVSMRVTSARDSVRSAPGVVTRSRS